MTDKYLDSAAKCASEAIEYENANDNANAINCYISSIEWLQMVIKYSQNPSIQDKVKLKIEEYLKRAEELQVSKASVKTGGNEKNVVATSNPGVTWNMVVGLEAAKESLQEAIILPMRFPQIFVRELKPWKGILLYGPPGTGKTFLAKACATESNSTFFSVSSSDIMDKWVGSSEKAVASLFSEARSHKPSIIFVDEIDSLCSKRGGNDNETSTRVKTEFLKQMDGIGSDSDGILILGATNFPWELDSAILRRFERRIYIPLPDKPARSQMFINSFCDLTSQQRDALAEATKGCSGADISIVVRDALMQRARKVQTATHFKKNANGSYTPCSPGHPEAEEMSWNQVPNNQLEPAEITFADFMKSVQSAKSSVMANTLTEYEHWTEEMGQKG